MPKHITVCFAGHSEIAEDKEEVYNNLMSVLQSLAEEYDRLTFLCGIYGDFDAMCTKAVTELKSTFESKKEIKLYVYIPYHEKAKSITDVPLYSHIDGSCLPDIPESTPKKIRILKTNEHMVNISDILICYVRYSFGGAVKTLKYAERKNIRIINISRN